MITSNTRRRCAVLAAALAATLAGCGGGGDDTAPSVSTLSATPLRYSRPMTVTVNGRYLQQGVEMVVDRGCGAVSRTGTNNDSTANFACIVNGLGELVIRIRSADGRELASLRVEVPTPQVSVTVSQGQRSGSFVVELDPERAPATVNQFLAYVNANFYRNVIFHRVIRDFVVQAGGYTSGPTAKSPTRQPIALESNNGLTNLRGTIAMARQTAPDSANAQWYVNVKDNPELDFVDTANPGYAVFGRVISGLNVVDEIAVVPVRSDTASGLTNLPVTNVTITAAAQIR